ncbi:uncharacterized protein LOC115157503 isoform X2 [Salmo trutta]|uniref:uncharacterized protein LOC115157503 isoform X2 n=1 Tax=Salmo trutta TaxID=8032 RepID=UPI00113036BA|nr:uncharacterized protein LOC115157503 isoform X2 [Salmo trutta]
MVTLHFPIAILLTLLHQAEPRVETSVFVLKGQDVRLNVQTNVTLQYVDVLYWKFNRSDNVVKYPPKVTFERYQGRVEFSEGNLSLLLKNLQEGDSGLYDAVVSGNKDSNVAAYLIKVQGDKEEIINTEYATVRTPGYSQVGGEEQESPGPASPSIYSMVGHHNHQPLNHPTMMRDQPPPEDLPMAPMTSMPESLYAVVGEKTSKQ